jgi:hypothetical protein
VASADKIGNPDDVKTIVSSKTTRTGPKKRKGVTGASVVGSATGVEVRVVGTAIDDAAVAGSDNTKSVAVGVRSRKTAIIGSAGGKRAAGGSGSGKPVLAGSNGAQVPGVRLKETGLKVIVVGGKTLKTVSPEPRVVGLEGNIVMDEALVFVLLL